MDLLAYCTSRNSFHYKAGELETGHGRSCTRKQQVVKLGMRWQRAYIQWGTSRQKQGILCLLLLFVVALYDSFNSEVRCVGRERAGVYWNEVGVYWNEVGVYWNEVGVYWSEVSVYCSEDDVYWSEAGLETVPLNCYQRITSWGLCFKYPPTPI